MLYVDAGEYWLHKTGKDTRPYLVSMYNVAVKVTMAIAGLVLGMLLTALNYTPGEVISASGATAMTWVTGLAPGLGYLLPVIVMLFHKISDKEMEKIIQKNAEQEQNGRK